MPLYGGHSHGSHGTQSACRDRKQIVPRDLFSASRVTATKNGIFSHFWWGQSYHGKCGGPFNPKPALPGPSLYPKAKRKKEKYNQAVEFIISHVCASLVFFFVFLGARLLISILPLLPLFSLAGTFYPSCSSAHCRIVIRLLNQKRPPFHRPILFIVSFFVSLITNATEKRQSFLHFFPSSLSLCLCLCSRQQAAALP